MDSFENGAEILEVSSLLLEYLIVELASHAITDLL